MHDYWTLMKKLIWLRILQGTSFVVNKITGTSPITLTNAINSAIINLKQYGKCVQDGTDIKCNNGTLKWDSVNQRIYADGTPEEIVVQGKNKFITTLQTTSAYGTTFTVNADGSITVSGTPTRQARVSMRSGSFVDTSSVRTFSNGMTMPTGTRIFCSRNHDGTVTYPTISNTHTLTVGDTYSNMLLEINTNYDGEPFTIYPMIEDGSTASTWQPYHHETATAENLFAVDNITDEQDIITGKVIRRTEAVVSDGTTPSGRYVGEVGVGNIIVKARETGYSGEIVSFTTEEETSLNGLRVNFEPIQDLHGYDAPWPAGGGKNKLPPALGFTRVSEVGVTLTENDDGTYTFSGTATATNIFDASINLPAGTYSFSAFNAQANSYVQLYFMDENNNVPGSITLSSANKTATFTSENPVVKLRFCALASYSGTFTFRPLVAVGSTAETVFSPYSNLCHISGHTEVDVTRTGKNLVKTKDSGRTNNQVTFTVNADGSIKAYGTATGGTAFFRSGGNPTEYGTYIKAGTYKLTGGISNTKVLYLIGAYVNGTAINNSTVAGGVYDRGNGLTFSLLNDAYITYQIQISNGTEADDTFYPMICEDTSAVASDFSPYAGTTYSVTFGALGKNLLDPSQRTTTSVNAYFYRDIGFLLKAGVTYTFSVYSSEVAAGVYFNEFGTTNNLAVKYNAKSVTYTPTEDIMAWFDAYFFSAPQGGTANVDAQLEIGSATAYEPYNDTVYGGYYDFVSGELVGDKYKASIKKSSFGNKISGSVMDYRNAGPVPPTASIVDWYLARQQQKSNMAKIANANSEAQYGSFVAIVYTLASAMERGDLRISEDLYQTMTEDEAVEVCYSLLNPVRYQLSPQAIETLRGLNNVWGNGKSVNVYVPSGEVVEQVTPQKLKTAEGTNMVEVTSNVDPVTLEVEYKINR